MNTSLLVVSALAGYWVLSRTYITHFVVDRHVGYRFIFETALAGLGILAAAHFLVRVASHFFRGWRGWRMASARGRHSNMPRQWW